MIEEQPVKNTEIQIQEIELQPPNKTNKKFLSSVAVISVIVVFLFALFFLISKFRQDTANIRPQIVPAMPSTKVVDGTSNETPAPTSTPTEKATGQVNKLEQYSHKKIQTLPFFGFSLAYPPNWVLSENDSTNETLFLNLKNQNGVIFKITQAPMGGGGCLYPDDPDLEGPYGRYGEYIQLNQSGATEWRRAEYLGDIPEMQKMFNVCEKQSENFVSLTKIGAIEYLFPVFDQAALIEMDEIVRSIKIDSN